ncbi:tRNA guanosine(15) transglycosylase TgtA [Saccharolobus solfataricus]|uniref:tRNA-guanine(15) transglycosylase n=3 Tax=Saccharolobus solfataricus TaxID=2287 RepID=ATGT_SACS2|nr:tRNA guanosine(15) transglycosylase TgtA [Saccharolobus solfataricus]Q980L7.1 RecName: Full=tRNA-guanine(15) transglycosylase; AltName: Full=7-cyano-7-deazaguanine tRNA-ribosyltransferase; AltName: Full=Archaeal tRNA-guanine transglycosylase [Saccharolobus solfataricus P2]AAK40613.1 Queuine/archaeosine-tRNA -ribosyltransferase (tgtA) [Saccharolobus solfataricus P2]AKA73590.1 tRNA guanosine(15) transglycosylase TgtA [Saccharolobus solfataricus]AKA76288.1 tRNA guanosine(15) transglycosylase Tg
MTVFEVKYEDLAGRIGTLRTRSGTLETPAFFPVINVLKKDEISIDEIRNIGFKNFITNSYILYKNNYIKDDIHKELRSEEMIIMTDSGAYQILEYGEIGITNLQIVNYQLKIKPDIGVILDLPTGNINDYDNAKKTVYETLKRAEEASEIIVKNQDNNIIWVYPIQGGRYLDLVKTSAEGLSKFEHIYNMAALGSPTVLLEKYMYDTVIDMIYTAKSNIKRGIPFHLFGGGLPHIIPFAVALGVDSFDSASYIIYARDNRYITRTRVYKLEDLEYFPCSCPICSKYTPKDLLEMNEKERTKALAIHNLYTILEEFKATKQAIKEGRLFEYLQEKAYSHPAVYSAFKRLMKYKDYLEKFDPRIRGDPKGLFLFDGNSLHRPEIIRHSRFLERYIQKKDKISIYCYDKAISDTAYDFKEKIREKIADRNESDVFIAVPFFGLIPLEISDSYPLSQFEIPNEIDEDVIDDMKTKIISFLRRNNYQKVELINCEKLGLHIDSISTSS